MVSQGPKVSRPGPGPTREYVCWCPVHRKVETITVQVWYHHGEDGRVIEGHEEHVCPGGVLLFGWVWPKERGPYTRREGLT